MPGYLRYDGVLYRAFQPQQLEPAELLVLRERFLIQSALFGLIGATNQICNYRFSAGDKLSGIDLKNHWREAHLSVWPRLANNFVVDLRSKAYSGLAPIPDFIPSIEIEVVESATGKAMSHMNKKTKGLFTAEVLRQAPNTVAQLRDVATAANLQLEIDGRRGVLLA